MLPVIIKEKKIIFPSNTESFSIEFKNKSAKEYLLSQEFLQWIENHLSVLPTFLTTYSKEEWLEWLTALNSGNYCQGSEALSLSGKYCCLGVQMAINSSFTEHFSDSGMNVFIDSKGIKYYTFPPNKLNTWNEFFSIINDDLAMSFQEISIFAKNLWNIYNPNDKIKD